MKYFGLDHCPYGYGNKTTFDREDFQREKGRSLDPSSKRLLKPHLHSYQIQFQTAKDLLVKDVLRSENNKMVVYSWDNLVQTTIELDSSGGLKFSRRTVNSSDKKEG